MREHVIAAALSPASAGSFLVGATLIVFAARPGLRAWYRSPVRWLGEPGILRHEGTAIVWGRSLAEVAPLVASAPDPVVVVVSTAPRPSDGPCAAERVAWIEPSGAGCSVIVRHADDLAEVWEPS